MIFGSKNQWPLGAILSGLLLIPSLVLGSSHREAPLIAEDPAADNTDTYAFVSPDAPNTVTIIANYIPLEEPAGGPNFNKFGDDVLYEIQVDNNGDSYADIRYQFSFATKVNNLGTFLYNTGPIASLDDSDWNVQQFYALRQLNALNQSTTTLASGLPTPPVNIGPTSTPNYEALAAAAVQTLPSGIKVFCGQRDDPFFVDLGGVFDLLTIRSVPGDAGGVDGVGGFNTHTIAMQIPTQLLTRDGQLPSGPDDPDAVIGIWATASRRGMLTRQNGGQPPQQAGGWIQVSRLGMPLVNEVVIPLGEKDVWNNSEPSSDGQFLEYVVTPEVAALLQLLYGINAPLTGRDDLVAVFLTGVPGLNQPPNVVPCEQIRLNTAIPPTDRHGKEFSRLGLLGGNLDGFPNGRRLEDDVTDIELQAVAGVTYSIFHPEWDLDPLASRVGDGVNQNDMPFMDTFPYVAAPHQGFEHQHHPMEPPQRSDSGTSGMTGIKLVGGKLSVLGTDLRPANTETPDLGGASGFAGNSPNPFRGMTTIAYRLASAGSVTVDVYDVFGRRVKGLVDQSSAPGSYQVSWDGTDESGNPVSSGTYFSRMVAGGTTETQKLTLQR